MEKNYQMVTFKDGEFSLDVKADFVKEIVWLTQKQMAILFNVSIDNISLHIKNVFNEGELNHSVSEKFSATASDGKNYLTKLFNLDMIIAAGYRVKSKRCVMFRKWANSILKDYLIKGYAVNEKRMINLNKTINIETRMLV